MERRLALMLGNRIKSIGSLMKKGQSVAAQEQMKRLKLNLDPVVITQYQQALTVAEKAYQQNDAEMLELIGSSIIDNLIGGG